MVGLIFTLFVLNDKDHEEPVWLIAAICMALFTWYFDRAWLLTILP
jgi:hypothetical protein